MRCRRARRLGETYLLARAAAARAGVTRLADIGGLAGLGLPVFQAVRPFARSLTVSQGKGGSVLAAKVSALLEAAELACAEDLPRPVALAALETLPRGVRECWSGAKDPLAINLDPGLPRHWVTGQVLANEAPMPMPWDMLSLDFTHPPLEIPAGSDGLATGNTREEALLAALCELVEHECLVGFEALSPEERRDRQIDTGTIGHAVLAGELARVEAAGFTPRLWSLGNDLGVAVVSCALFAPEPVLDHMAPTAGSACHPDPVTAALAALREAVQARAALVAGARDDLVPADYREGRQRTRALALTTFAIGEGELPFAALPAPHWASMAQGVELLRQVITRLTPLPVIVYDHTPPAPGLHVVHALAPGLRNLCRRPAEPARVARLPFACRPAEHRAVLFAGPSIVGVEVPPQIDLRWPAVCGDLAALLSDPPGAVGLVDGYFGLAPTVWHKEVLALLARGVRVLGAASLGALRAAELADAGMEGVGAIYAAYRAGAIVRDDAVMLLHAPADYGFAPLTVALVDAEHTLAAIPCDARDRRMMQRIVRTMPFRERSWSNCRACFSARTGRDFAVGAEVLAQYPSLKRADAALLVQRLEQAARGGLDERLRPDPPATGYFLRLLATIPPGAAPGPERRSPDDPARAAAASARPIR